VVASTEPRALFANTVGETARPAGVVSDGVLPYEPAREPSARAVTQSEVLRAAAAGQAWAYAALYDELHPFVAAALQKILHYTPDYDDLVQTSFELIVRSLRRPRPRPIENLGAWSSAIAARVALSSLRVKIRERRIFNRDNDGTTEAENTAGPALERQLDLRRELRWLQEALAAMHPEQAEAILLHDVLGYDLVEMARSMDVSVAAAQKRLSRGHIELRGRAERNERKGGT
jgi:RNA polymerase sigma factor (sigma-70 family)